jgi:hypothetical protein
MPSDRIPLTHLSSELRHLGVVAGYRQLYGAVVDGRIPAQHAGNGKGGQWTVARDDLALIAGLVAQAAIPASVAA